jgi:ABC-type Zn uptake system ZnuABC Zn-binding protein ZnuA
MKKSIMPFALVAVLGMAACGNAGGEATEAAADSTAVETPATEVVETVATDTVAVDSTAAVEAPAH